MPRLATLVLTVALVWVNASAQTADRSCDITRPQDCVINVVRDQGGIWSSPARAKAHDLVWILPFAAATGVAIAFDAHAMNQLGSDPSTLSAARHISDAGAIYLPLGTIGVGYLVARTRHDDHLRRTTMLAGEAIGDALLVTEALKYATDRERPDIGEGRGEFWAHGLTNYQNGRSFPSGHSAMAWSFAHVIADEYPHWWTDAAVYGLATTVSVTRVVARQHFPSDVIVGSTLGYLVGGYVYRHREPNTGHALNISPVASPGTIGVSVSFR